jgi:hypothetical protein
MTTDDLTVKNETRIQPATKEVVGIAVKKALIANPRPVTISPGMKRALRRRNDDR